MTKDDYPRCHTCEYYDPNDVPDYEDVDAEDKGLCERLSEETKTDAGSLAVETYFKSRGHVEFYGHAIFTREDFGCIHHSDLEDND